MLGQVTAPTPDAILRIMALFADDPRTDKIDLGVGVYRDASGTTPVMRAVREAEQRMWQGETTKGYVALAGDPAFHAALRDLALGDAAPEARIAACATTGGTGAVRQAFDLIRMTAPDRTVWVSAPTWPNHIAVLDQIGQTWRPYRYHDPATGALDREGMMADLAGLSPGDTLLLHGCCHNPTGIDLSADDWHALANLCADKGVLPMIDLAYQGFGTGIDEDVAGLRALIAATPEALVCVSGSKTFGIYRERAGAVFAVVPDGVAKDRVQARLAGLNRQAYAFPPDHGARLATMVLTDPALRADWAAELASMRARIAAMRRGLAEALRDATGSDRFGFLTDQRGMFSLIGATPEQVEILRRDHALYIIGDGRINVAGLTPATIPPTAERLAAVLG